MGMFNIKDIFGKFNKPTEEDVYETDASTEDSTKPRGIFANKKLLNIIVWIIIGVIALMAFGNCGDRGSGALPIVNEDTRLGDGFDITEYRQMLERDMSEALSRMYGAGEVRVTISFENSGELVLATDRQSNEERNREGVDGTGRNNYRISHEDRIVLHGSRNQATTPIVIRENAPQVSGVLIVAEGANDERIRLELHQAARAVLGAPAHRIQVVAKR